MNNKDYSGTIEQYNLDYLIEDEESIIQSIQSTNYELQDLNSLNDLIVDFMHNPIDQHAISIFRRKLGSISHNLDIGFGKSFQSTMNHLFNCVKLAQMLTSEGYIIHLIEATDHKGVKRFGDIDIWASKNGIPLLIDYTQSNLHKSNAFYTILPADKYRTKYTKLEGKLLSNHVSWVVSCSKCDVAYNLKPVVDVYDSSPFEKDFLFYDSAMNYIDKITVNDAKRILQHYTDNGFNDCSYHGSEFLTSPSALNNFYEQHSNNIIEYLKYNNPISGKALDQLQNSLPSVESERDYFHHYYNKLTQCKEGPLFKTPLPGRIREYNLSPYDRLKQIKSDLKGNRSALIDLLLLSEDGHLHPTPEEDYELSKLTDYDWIKGIKVQRLKRRGDQTEEPELVNAVKMFYDAKNKTTMRNFVFNKNRKMEVTPNVENHQTLEECEMYYDVLSEQLIQPSQSSRYMDDLKALSSGIMTDKGVSEQVRGYINAMISEISKTKIGDYLSFLSERSVAMCNSQRKKLISEPTKGSIKSNQMVFSLDAVSDRSCVVMTSMNLMLGEIGNQVFCSIMSDQTEMPDSCRTIGGVSRFENMSSEDTNWYLVIYHKFLSWCTYGMESVLSVKASYTKEDLKDTIVMPAIMMLINSLGFAQAAESIRYLFLGSVGMSTDQYKIIEKIEWFTPSTFVEKIYLLRMVKMINFLSLTKSHNRQASLYKNSASKVSVGGQTVPQKFRTLAVAFPNETKYVLRDDHCYNMFYVCRAFQIDRQSELLGEALVVEKQKEAREEYLRIKSENRKHESRFQDPFSNEQDMVFRLLSFDYDNCNADVYSPNPYVVIIGVINTLLRYYKPGDKVLSDIKQRVYDIDDKDAFTPVSTIMNNRGSLRKSLPNGISKYRTEKDKKDKSKMHTITQNSKSYETILQLMVDYVENNDLPSVENLKHGYDTSLDQPVKRGLTQNELKKIKDLPDNLSQLFYYCISKKALFTSKSTHKGDIATREIATLNAVAKVCCKVVEDFARCIRDNEHSQNDYTNLIEVSDKDEIFKRSFIKSLQIKDPEVCLYDSADCSKWGPGMMSPVLYFVVGSRMNNSNKQKMLRNFFTLFSQRKFKLPDRLYNFAWNKETIIEDSGSKVEQIVNWMRNDDSMILGDIQNQYFDLEEGMYQGILGNCSSCLAADAARLSETVQSKIMSEINFRSETKVTSDDYNRCCVFNTSIYSVSEVMRKSVAITMKNQLNFGIRRNKQKSTMSTKRSELNSKFLDESGDYKPDIKSRLSYVDYDHTVDMVPSAMRCNSLACEYLRSEGSLVGAVICGLLNTHLHMIKHGIRPLFRMIGKSIFRVPLELGGLMKIDPLKSVCSSEYISLIDNYGGDEMSSQKAVRMLEELSPNEADQISTDIIEGSMKAMVPRLSRSATIHLARREKRSLRSIRELLDQVPDEWYEILRFPGNSSLIRAIMGCIKREELTEDGVVRSKVFSACQTNHEAKLYRLNSAFLIDIIGEKTTSRKKLFETAVNYLSGQYKDKIDNITSKDIILPFDHKSMDRMRADYEDFINKTQIVSIGSCKIKTSQHHTRLDFFPTGMLESMLFEFQLKFKPKILGGSSTVKPMVYLESEMMLREKLIKLSRRKQVFNFSIMSEDLEIKYLPRFVLSTGFARGVRPELKTTDHWRLKTIKPNELVETILALNNAKKGMDPPNFLIHDPLSSHFPALIRTNKVRAINLTNVVNSIHGTSETHHFSNPETKQDFLESMLSYAERVGKTMVINPSELVVPTQSYEYKMPGGDRLYVRPVVSEGKKNIGVETIFKRSGKYVHNITLYQKGSIKLPADSKTDRYNLIDLHSEINFPVRLSYFSGYICISVRTDNEFEVIDVLGSSIKSVLNTYTLITSGTLIDDYNIDELIKRKKDHEVMNEYEAPQIEEELGFHEDKEEEEDALNQEDIIEDDNLSSILGDDELMEYFDSENETEKDDSTTSDEESYYEDSDDESNFSAALSRQSGVSAKYVLNQQKMISRSSLYYVKTAEGIKKVNRRIEPYRTRFKHLPRTKIIYELRLPFKLSNQTWVQSGDNDILTDIINELASEVDSTWKIDYFLETILNSADLAHQRSSVGLE